MRVHFLSRMCKQGHFLPQLFRHDSYLVFSMRIITEVFAWTESWNKLPTELSFEECVSNSPITELTTHSLLPDQQAYSHRCTKNLDRSLHYEIFDIWKKWVILNNKLPQTASITNALCIYSFLSDDCASKSSVNRNLMMDVAWTAVASWTVVDSGIMNILSSLLTISGNGTCVISTGGRVLGFKPGCTCFT